MNEKMTVSRIRAQKGRKRIPALTAVDYTSAQFADRAGIPLILVGDSLGMTVLGYPNTLSVTLDAMLHHAAAVMRGVKQALVVGDMPFLSYQISREDALRNAGRFLQEAGVDAVKIEGGQERADTVRALVGTGIPVMGHIGLTPQSVKEMGYKVQGRGSEAARKLLDDAKALQDAGVFALVLEACPVELAAQITEAVSMPTIGIGAGPHCDGQILVMHDLLGMFPDFTPTFVKRYAEIGAEIEEAYRRYLEDVREGRFPGPEHTYG